MKKIGRYDVKPSKFLIWAISFIIASAILLLLYIIASECNWLDALQKKVNAECGNTPQPSHDAIFASIFIVAIGYVTFSLLIAVKSASIDEDPRLHLLSVLVTPIFLIVENALLHIMHVGDLETNASHLDEYYSVTMSVFCAIAVAITTFSSLKYSFDLSSRRQRFNETAKAKPDFNNASMSDNAISVTISRNPCYINGIFVGDIERFKYIDSKRPGTLFLMEKLYFTNSKYYLHLNKNKKDNSDVETEHTVSIRKLLPDYDVSSFEEIVDEAKEKNLYLIIRDTQNYYYFVQVQMNNEKRFVVGVSENTMSHLVNKHNAMLRRVETDRLHKKQRKVVKYEVVDRFVIPYNFFPDLA